jgi:hypothetical protein
VDQGVFSQDWLAYSRDRPSVTDQPFYLIEVPIGDDGEFEIKLAAESQLVSAGNAGNTGEPFKTP